MEISHDIAVEMIIRLAVATLAGFLLGLEREIHRKAAGVRTIALICVSSALFTMLSQQIGAGQSSDRIASNILTGVGFIGAGVIFRGGFTIDGITTAAVIWISAAIGMAIGTGQYITAGAAVVITLLALWMFSYAENMIVNRRERKYYAIRYRHKTLTQETLEAIFRDHGLKYTRLTTSKYTEEKTGDIIFEGKYEMRGPNRLISEMNDRLLQHPEVVQFDVELAK
ncbi:MgtC/SapB family protein [Chitinophaga barathri]|uniref:MgtC/SapB family protein n=2 Tax=Chitinophaga barathri TaxID=1647451 RepID=A0A3N4M8R3_9BACT|nr:MgtC/SapB family protein [Chitinophaga barathri]